MQELDSIAELLTLLVTDPRSLILFALLIIASVSDFRTYRIPNWLTAPGTAFGLLYSAAVPFSLQHGFLWALGGMLVGFLILLPLYAVKALGAGDVKLMAMAGAFLGVDDAFGAVIATFIVGGIAALAFGFFKKSLGRMLANIKSAAQIMMLSVIGGIRPDARMEIGKSVGRLPYGVSIGIGTIGYVVAKQLGFT